jgi:hypothetical protein
VGRQYAAKVRRHEGTKRVTWELLLRLVYASTWLKNLEAEGEAL